MTIEGVAFDFDGTLYPYSHMYRHAIPIFLKYPRFLYHFIRTRLAMREITPIHDFRERQAELLAVRLGISQSRAYARIEEIVYNQWERIFENINAYPGLREALKSLKKMGLKTAVLSDYPVESKLKYLSLDGLWDCAFSSEETGYLKPHPQAFLKLAGFLKIPPHRILYVGNIYAYDIIGAYRVGMRTAFLTRSLFKRSLADIQFSSYHSFIPRMAEKFG